MGQNKINTMSFLDEVTYNVKPGQEVPDIVKDDDVVNIGEKKKDHDGDGDIDSDDYLIARDKAIKQAKMKEEKAKQGYGKNPKTGKFEPMSSDDAIQGFLQKVKDKESMKEVTIDLNEFIMNKLDEGKSQEDVIKLTKALMKKLHDKGEVKVDGTKLVFKEADVPQDTQLALPEPPARDYLGDDGKDYEGGMAKSQLLKMKSYADKLCNMVDDESQLEAWVQAKLTKASDYMSAVFHYLDYQNSKMGDE